MTYKPYHGNRLRPPQEAYERKKMRSRETYAKSMLEINPFWLNEKILRKYYNLHGSELLEIKVLIDEGFDFDMVREKTKIADEVVFMMKKFGYSISRNKMIKIWKIS